MLAKYADREDDEGDRRLQLGRIYSTISHKSARNMPNFALGVSTSGTMSERTRRDPQLQQLLDKRQWKDAFKQCEKKQKKGDQSDFTKV